MGERDIDVDSVPFELTIENVEKVENGNLIIKWNKKSNQPDSILPIDFLIFNCPSILDRRNSEPVRKKFKFTKVKLISFYSSLEHSISNLFFSSHEGY